VPPGCGYQVSVSPLGGGEAEEKHTPSGCTLSGPDRHAGRNLGVLVFREPRGAGAGAGDSAAERTQPISLTWLARAKPNPTPNSSTWEFSLQRSGHTRLEVFDVSGRLVRTLVDGVFEAGIHSVMWNGADASGRDLPSGVYQCRMTGNGVLRWNRVVIVH
jgi:hypothetical protein